jgi:hypothetical protein
MKCAVGSYTGNGTDNRAITGVGFQPDLVIIKNRVSNWGCFRTSGMTGDSTAYFAQAAANFAGGIKSLDADGFTVGTHASVNTSGQVYDWQAFKDDDAGDFKVGSYVGTGVDNRNITGLGFQPDLVCLKVNGTAQDGVWRTASNSGDQSMRFSAADDAADHIQSLLADGFQVGLSQNASGSTYHWFAFKAVAGFMGYGAYTGDATDNRNITGLGFQPDLLWVKGAGLIRCAVRPSTLTGDSTVFYSFNTAAADWIQALLSDGFQVGTQLNASGVAHRYFAWKVGATSAPTEKSSSDSGAGAESASVVEAYSGSDSGAGTESVLLAAEISPADSGAATETSELVTEGEEIQKTGADSGAATETAALATAAAALDSGAATEVSELLVPVASADAGTATETALIFPLVDFFELAVTVTPALTDRFELIAQVLLDRVADSFELQVDVSPLVADPFLLMATIINQDQEAAAAQAVIAPTAEVAFLE